MRGFDPASLLGFSPTRPYGASERERPWLGLVTWLQNKINSTTQRFLVPAVPWTPGTMSPFCVLNAMKSSLQIMSLAAYASETNKLTLAITHTTGMCCLLLGYSLEPRQKSRALCTAGYDHVRMLALGKPVWREKTRLSSPSVRPTETSNSGRASFS